MMAPPATVELVVFSLDGQRYAVALDGVQRVVRMVLLAPFPKAPEIVLGVFNFHGRLIPVVDVRRRFRLPGRAPKPSDQIIVMRTARRGLGLAVDAVESVLTAEASTVVATDAVVPHLEYLRGIMRMPDGIIFVHDVDAFLSLEEETQLEQALGGCPT